MRYLVTLFIMYMMLSPAAIAQQEGVVTLSGTVKGIDGQALEDVTISVLGQSGSPAVSDQYGKYQIEIPATGAWLSFQPLGNLIKKTIYVDGHTSLDVYLGDKRIYSAYDALVADAIGTKSRDVVTAHESITETQMRNTALLTVDQYLQTSVAGASVSNMSGVPFSGTSAFLRGISSINAGNEPLYVVDGIPLERANYYTSVFDGYNFNPITTIDPFDISYVTIYNDPSYTSKYGFYGANGVVELRTIDPNLTKTSIDVRYRTGISMQPEQLPQLNSTQYKSLAKEVLFSSGIPQEEYMLSYPGLFVVPEDGLDYVPYQHNTDWQNEVFQDAILHNVHFSIKGGDAIAKYGMSFGYLTSDGLFKGTSYKKFNTRFVSEFKILERIKMFVNVNLVNSTSHLRESAIESSRSPVLSSLWKSPQLSPFSYDDDANILTITAPVEELGISNPYVLANGFTGINKNIRFLASSKLTGDITNDLKLIALVGVNYNATTENSFSPDLGMDTYLNGEAYNESLKNINTFYGLYLNSYFSYHKDIGNKHKFLASLGTRVKIDEFESDFGIARNTPNDNYQSLSTGVDKLREVGGNNIDYRWLSMYGDMNYVFLDKYIANVQVSSDASSAIGEDAETLFSIGNVPFSPFYSAGVAWRISSERFMRKAKGIEELKLRASYGTSGSDNFDVLLSRSHFVTSHYNVLGVAVPGNLANTALKNETRSMLNLGLDFALKGGRHQLKVDVYNSVTNDALLFRQMESYLGENYFPLSAGQIGNKGAELSLASRLVSYKDFNLDMGLKVGMFRNEVLDMPFDNHIVSLPGAGEMITKIGEPVNSFYGYLYEGVYASNASSNNAGMVNDKGNKYRGGDAIYSDLSGARGLPDKVIDNHDKTILGNPNPDVTGGFNIKLSYKGWSLKAVSQFVVGQEVYNYIRYQNEKMSNLNNQSVKTLQRWVHEGQQTDVPRAQWGDPMGNSSFSSRWIEDGSYLRLKELTLAYRIDKKMSALNSIEVYVTTNNLYTWTNYVGYDPEMSYSHSPYLQGVDYGLAPQAQTFMIGVNIGL